MISDLLLPLGIALGLGLLVGLQREWATEEVAGIRTFSLITMLGVLAGAMGEALGGWSVAAAWLGLAALLVWGNVARARAVSEGADFGLTTEVAALVMFGVGAALALGQTVPALVAGGVVAVLLQAKEPLHGMVDALSDRDVRALFQFVLVALVVLPVLPDRAWGPYGVLNPFRIWLMVVLIVGISIAAWAAYRLLGRRRGTALTGLLGGLISSTATTVSQARRSRDRVKESPAAAFIILAAAATVFVRVLVEIAVVARDRWMELAPPLVVMLGLMLVVAAIKWIRTSHPSTEAEAAPEAPSELRPAMLFGLLYALVLLAVAAARQHLGAAGLYGVAFLSGLTDMDAITLSTANLVNAGQVEAATGWRVILVGGLANLVFKGGVVLGSPRLSRPVLVGFGTAVAGGAVLLGLWP